jgi:N-dimethylarginine dimethylaminohydrolase
MNPTKILMCNPNFYGVEYEINPWMKGNLNTVDIALAHTQWNHLKFLIEQHSTVVVMDGIPSLPDMVFTANAGLTINNSVVVSQFKNKERQPESSMFTQWFKGQNYDIVPINNGVTFEGAGDCLIGKNVYWCGYGFRTSRGGAVHLQNIMRWWYDKTVILLELIDERFYHLDTCFCPLRDGSVLLYRPAISEDSYKLLERVYGSYNIIEVSLEDAMNFACNAVNINNTIIVSSMSNNLKQKLIERDFDIIETPMSEFMKSGGSCKCLTLEI